MKYVLVIGFIVMTLQLEAQWRELRMTELGPEQGLATKVVEVIQDHSGFIYMATSQGLIRYDGANFELFAHHPDDTTTIGPGELRQILVGSDSLIWIGTRHGGLASFDPGTDKFRRYPLPQLDFLTIPAAAALMEDEKGSLWVGGYHFQLLNFDRASGTFTSYQPGWIDPGTHGGRLAIASIIQDVQFPDIFWLAVVDYFNPESKFLLSETPGYGLVSFNRATGEFKAYPNSGKIVYQDSLRHLFGVNLPKGITIFDPETENQEILEFPNHFPFYQPRDIIQMNSKNLIIRGFDLLEFNLQGGFKILHSIDRTGPVQYSKMNRDRAGNIWVSRSQGVSVINADDQLIRYFSLLQFGQIPRIYPGRIAFDEEENTLFLSCHFTSDDHRVYQIPTEEARVGEAREITVPYLMTGLAFDLNGTLYAAGGGGAHRYNGKSFDRIAEQGFEGYRIPPLWNMRTSSNGWIAGIGSEEFFWFYPDSIPMRYVQYNSLETWAVIPDHVENLGGFKHSRKADIAYLVSGVVHEINLASGQTRLLKFDKRFNPLGQELTDVQEDREGDLWIAGVKSVGKFEIRGDSLILLDQFGAFNGLVTTIVHELHCDRKGRIWLFTDSGINAIDPSTREIRYFGVGQGLPDVYIDPRQILESSDGRIITVNNNGIIVFDSDSLWHAHDPPSIPVIIKQIRVNGKNIAAQNGVNSLKSIAIQNGSDVVDIQFQGLSLPTDKNVRYCYRLRRGDKWIDIGKNKFVTLHTLSPGSYEFQVKAGAPMSKAPVRSLSITVPAPLFQKPWFIALLFGAALFLFYLLYQLRIRSIRQKEAQKTAYNKRIAEFELKALRSQMNPHFMFNSLNSIKNFILQSRPREAAEYLSDFAHLVRLILQNSRERTVTLQEELDTLVLYIGLEQLRFDNTFRFTCIVDEGIDLEQIHIPPMLLQPYVENAIWHGLMNKKEEGHLLLHFERVNGYVNCIVDDDGIGRSKSGELKRMSARKYKSMGTGITGDRIDILNKTDSLGIEVSILDKTDEQGNSQGTRVTLSIPNGDESYEKSQY